MSTNPWFRMYGEDVDDLKLRRLAAEDRWHFVAILCIKAQGFLDTGSSLRDVEELVYLKLGLQRTMANHVKRRLMEAELVDEYWQPLAWDRRQSGPKQG